MNGNSKMSFEVNGVNVLSVNSSPAEGLIELSSPLKIICQVKKELSLSPVSKI